MELTIWACVSLCITVDPESPKDGKFTVRDRDSMTQERVSYEEFLAKMYEALEF